MTLRHFLILAIKESHEKMAVENGRSGLMKVLHSIMAALVVLIKNMKICDIRTMLLATPCYRVSKK